jgi:hypothetical protein
MNIELTRFSDGRTFTSIVRIVLSNGHKGRPVIALICERTAMESSQHSILRTRTQEIEDCFRSCYEAGGGWLTLVEMLAATAATDEEKTAVDIAARDLQFREAMAEFEAMGDVE